MRPVAAAVLFFLLVGFVRPWPVRAEPEAPPPESVPAHLPPGLKRELNATLNQPTRDQANHQAGKAFLGTEALFLMNSYFASVAPKIYGGASLVLFPAGALSAPPSAERNTSLLLMEGLAAYNLFGVDDDEMSEGEIFRANLLAWHGILVTRSLVRHLSARRREKAADITVLPLPGGGAVRYARRF